MITTITFMVLTVLQVAPRINAESEMLEDITDLVRVTSALVPQQLLSKLANQSGTTTIKFTHDGILREALVYVPAIPAPYVPPQGLPLVLDFHAWGSDALAEAVLTDFNTLAAAEGFVVAYPKGHSQADAGAVPLPLDPGVGFTHNAGGCCPAACRQKMDDIGFAKAVVTFISTQMDLRIDSTRVYATGMSNGGFMSHRIGCEASDVFAAIAPVSGLLMNDTTSAGLGWAAEEYACSPKRAVPVLHFHGTLDPLVPIMGNPVLGFKPVQHTIDAWRTINNATGQGLETYKHGVVKCTSWGADANNVTYCTAAGAGHSWPGSHNACPPLITPAIGCTDDIDATEEIWAFFKRHSLV